MAGIALQGRLTEHGLARALGRQDVSPRLLKEMSPEQVARMIERQRYGRRTSRKAKKASKKRADGVVRHAKKAKAKSVGRSATLSVQPSYWRRVNREVHLLICTDDKKYDKLRKYVGKESKPTQFAIVTAIAGTIGAYIGVAATVIAPLVTLALMVVLQVGKNAWCAGQA